MKISVETNQTQLDTYEAEKWVIDDSERLHIVGSGGVGNVASYNRGAWASVWRIPQPDVGPAMEGADLKLEGTEHITNAVAARVAAQINAGKGRAR